VIEFPSFVPETMNLLQLFHALQKQRRGLAVVLDEFGGVAVFGDDGRHSRRACRKNPRRIAAGRFRDGKDFARPLARDGTMRLDDFRDFSVAESPRKSTSRIVRSRASGRANLFHHETFRLRFGADFSDKLAENVFHRHQTGDAAKFIQHDGEAATLLLQSVEKLEQIHRLRHERRKFNHLRQTILDRAAMRAVQNADDCVRRFIVNRQAAMLEFFCGAHHFIHRRVVGDA